MRCFWLGHRAGPHEVTAILACSHSQDLSWAVLQFSRCRLSSGSGGPWGDHTRHLSVVCQALLGTHHRQGPEDLYHHSWSTRGSRERWG